jgi:biotin carboxyl carrier protein
MPARISLRDSAGNVRTAVVSGEGVAVDGAPATPIEIEPDGSIRVNGRRAWAAGTGDERWVFLDGEAFRFEIVREGSRRSRGAHEGSLAAPMPATVVRIQVPAGSAVTKGQTLIVLEAMKMELPVHAPADGTVVAVLCREGELVQAGAPLVEFTRTEA